MPTFGECHRSKVIGDHDSKIHIKFGVYHLPPVTDAPVIDKDVDVAIDA